MKKKDFRLYASTISPPLFIIIFIAFSAYKIVLPSIKSKFIEQQKETLKDIGELSLGMLNNYNNLSSSGSLTLEQAKSISAKSIENIKFGRKKENYIWIIDENHNFISHPHFLGSNIRNENSNIQKNIFNELKKLNNKKDGFIEYKWPYKNDTTQYLDKMSYVIKFEPWDWIIGTSINNKDITNEVNFKLHSLFNRLILIYCFIITALIFIIKINYTKLKEIKKKEDVIYTNKSYLQGLSDHTGDGLIIIENNKLVFVNNNFKSMLHVEEENIKLELLDFILDNTKDSILEDIKHSFDEDDFYKEYELWINTLNNEKRFLNCKLVSSLNDLGVKIMFLVITDFTEKKLARERIKELSDIVLQAPTAIMVSDLQGNIEFTNPAFEKRTGYSKNEIQNKNISILKPNNQPEQVYTDLWQAISKGETWQSEIMSKDKYGNFFWELSTVYPLRNENGNIIKFAYVKTDINELKQIKEELIKAKNKAEESEKLKNAFLANISHEINTPLNAINGFTQLLVNDKSLHEKHIEQLQIILKNSNILVKIFNDIIVYSKNDSGIIDVNTKCFELNNLIFKICSRYNLLLIKNKKLPLELKFLPDRRFSSIKLNSDKELLSEIFNKLIDNAIKYTSEGDIIVKYNIEPDAIKFSIQDSGPGILEEDKEKIFELFYHGGQEFVSLHKGLGIGLNLVKSYVEILGGEIHFESAPNSGTVFYFTLPKHIVSYV